MAAVKIVEVGPRDGLQNISQIVPTATKAELIRRLACTGLTVIEATSFVSPKWIPQLADSAEVLQRIWKDQQKSSATSHLNISFPVLVPNIKGLERASENGAQEVAVFVSAGEGFSRKNINCSVTESLVRVRQVTKRARELGIQVRGYVSCIFEDPYDGKTEWQKVAMVTQALLDTGCYEVSLGDTLGVGTPADVEKLFSKLLRTVPAAVIAGHFHDTYGQALANVGKAYELGIRTFDSSIAGLGGCPFAKGAKGNLSTEDLVYTFEKSGISTGVNLDELVKIGTWISKQIGIPNGSRAGSAIAAKLSDTASRPQSASPPRKWQDVKRREDYRVSRNGVNVEIRLTKGANGNSLTTTMIKALIRLFQDFSLEQSVSRIILSAEGKYFCTGMDLKGTNTVEEQFENLRALFQTIDDCPKTTIALINGPCFGGGVGLAFVCDIRIATLKTTFTLSEVRLGLCPATISKYVIRELGFSHARTAMLTATPIQSSELANLKILHSVVKDEVELRASVENLLQTLRFTAPGASKLSKDLVRVAYTSMGEAEQSRVIKASFDQMMATGSEHSCARLEFKKGNKTIDWEARPQHSRVSKI